MKILHTADWHIGKKLHKHDLTEDFDRFLTWLCELIQREQVDVLLVSGDIFDLANPSSEARQQYFRALLEMRKFECKIIMTGGNHDSPAMLDAPKEILQELNIHIIGGLPREQKDLLIPITGASGQPEMIIAAIPFLRDSDLRRATDGLTFEDRLEATQKGIQEVFSNAAQRCSEAYPGLPAIAMGHLFAAGMQTSESEREIQIGNQAAFEASSFGSYFSYIALGHIHKPQQVSAPVPTFYSGSPFPLSFSERTDHKRVLLLDSTDNWTPHSIPVPAFRSLLKLNGNLDQLRHKLDQLPDQKQLESLLEIELEEDQYDATKLYQLDELVSRFSLPGYRIVKHRAFFKNQLSGASDVFAKNQQLKDLKPKEIFLKLIEDHPYNPETSREIISSFDEILEEVIQDSDSTTTGL